jgi:hypothetical protein
VKKEGEGIRQIHMCIFKNKKFSKNYRPSDEIERGTVPEGCAVGLPEIPVCEQF